MYGVRHSVLLVFLKFGMRLLYKVLKEDEGAQVCIPTPEKNSRVSRPNKGELSCSGWRVECNGWAEGINTKAR
jgi:hypothetical protein